MIWLTSLNENLKVLRELTDKFQKELIAERKMGNAPAENRNEYQPGDLVLYDTCMTTRHAGQLSWTAVIRARMRCCDT